MSLFNRKKKNSFPAESQLEQSSPALEAETEKNGLLNRLNPFAKKEQPALEEAGGGDELYDASEPARPAAEAEKDGLLNRRNPFAPKEGDSQFDDGLSASLGPISKPRMNFLRLFKQGLTKTRENLAGKIQELVENTRKLDDDFWEELEEILIQADVGVNTSVELVSRIRQSAKKQRINDSHKVVALIQQEVATLLQKASALNLTGSQPAIIMVVGVNGAGKTTSIAKMAYRFKQEGRHVMLAAADTFRAAAIDQLQIWADRVGVELIKHKEGSDPGAVVFDAINAARARQADILIIDTAGRLQNKTNLMKELSKVRKIIEREIGQDPQEVLLVLDATTGQNAVSQARIFQEATGVTGIILTKLDGTAKGGIILAIARELEMPVKLIGIGETLDDLRDFDPDLFAQALFETDAGNGQP
jgi:fused signal recognition particle receptor